jgi:hypothetical protein
VPSAAPDAPAVAVSAVERSFCELLVHHGDEQEIAALIDALAPPVLLTHPQARAIHDAWRRSRRGDPEALTRLSEEGSAGVRDLLQRLVRSDPRMAHAREATTAEATLEILARLWMAHLKAEHLTLSQTGAAQDERRRLEIKTRLKALERPRTPEERAAALAAERERLPDAAGSVTAAPPTAAAPASAAPPAPALAEAPPAPAGGDWMEEEPIY